MTWTVDEWRKEIHERIDNAQAPEGHQPTDNRLPKLQADAWCPRCGWLLENHGTFRACEGIEEPKS